MSKFTENFKRDVDREEEGIWVELYEGVLVNIVSTSSKRYLDATERLTKPHRDRIRRKTISNRELNRISALAISQGALIDWRGVTDDKGKAIPFTQEAADKMLTDPAYQPFVDAIAEAAGNHATFLKEFEEDTGKNSPKTSDGK